MQFVHSQFLKGFTFFFEGSHFCCTFKDPLQFIISLIGHPPLCMIDQRTNNPQTTNAVLGKFPASSSSNVQPVCRISKWSLECGTSLPAIRCFVTPCWLLQAHTGCLLKSYSPSSLQSSQHHCICKPLAVCCHHFASPLPIHRTRSTSCTCSTWCSTAAGRLLSLKYFREVVRFFLDFSWRMWAKDSHHFLGSQKKRKFLSVLCAMCTR